MRRFVLVIVCCLTAASAASAQSTTAAQEQGEVLQSPVCFNVINRAPYTVIGTFSTNYYSAPDGTRARHRANFRLGKNEKTNFCTSGPFYPQRKLDLSIHSLIPLFHCMTGVDGDITIHGEELPSGDGTKTWADCR